MQNFSMKQRALQFLQNEERRRANSVGGGISNDPIAPIEQFAEPTYGIVGNEVVRARYITHTPGFSQTIVCSDIRQSWTAPVSVGEVRLVGTLEQALFLRDTEQLGQLAGQQAENVGSSNGGGR